MFRTPLLPHEDYLAWGEGVDAASAADDHQRAEALVRDCEILRERLREVAMRPEVRDAIFVASPDLDESLQHWMTEPDSQRGQKVERSLVRYFSRMTGRATPFGLFSAVSAGRLGDQTRLETVPLDEYERHTRLDNDYLFALCEDLARDPAMRASLTYRVNSSLYSAAGRLRYAEARLQGKLRSHHLVAVEPTDYLMATLERARGGATRGQLAAALVEDDPEVELAEAEEFVDELIESQLLVSDLSPAVTGDEPIHGILSQLRELAPAADMAEELGAAQSEIEAIDTAGIGQTPERYRSLAKGLGKLPTKVELNRLFQVDMVKPSPGATLGKTVVAEVERGIGILHSMSRAPRETSVTQFADAFSARYEDREVPLVEALDEEVGIGFEAARGPTSEASPLLAGLQFPGQAREQRSQFGYRETFLLRRLEKARANGDTEIALDDEDLQALASNEASELPDAFSTMFEIAADSAEDLERGDFLIQLEGGGGPSGARLTGRFCHASEELQRGVAEHLRAEEALRPDAVFAEIAHLPEGRIGNILCRPVLREYEIPYLGVSGAPPDRWIPVGDLTVSVARGRVVLRSRRLGREVIPRPTTAHNFGMRSLGVYRFLCSLQSQGTTGFGWSWGALDNAEFLPRVRCGKLVFSRARWLLVRRDLEGIKKAFRGSKSAKSAAEIQALRGRVFAAVQELRERRGLPRRVVLADADNELPVDLDNALSVDSFAHLIKSRGTAVLNEELAGPGENVGRGPEGSFVCQVALSFVREREPTRWVPPPPQPSFPRRFGPGSEWLYAKLYTGTSTADEVLRQMVAPVARQAIASGAAREWFFIRYGDPDWHLRVRFRGDPEQLRSGVLPLIERGCNELLSAGLLWRVQLDTYEREMERYGGPDGVELAERAFCADSEAIVAIVDLLSGDEGMDARWRLALRGSDMLLEELGLDLAEKYEVMASARESMGREFFVDAALGKQLGAKFRAERPQLVELLERDPERDRESHLAPGYEALARRSEAMRPIAEELKAREAAGRLSSSIKSMAWSYVHMHNNRLLRSVARAQELVIYDFLKRYYESVIARSKAKRKKK